MPTLISARLARGNRGRPSRSDLNIGYAISSLLFIGLFLVSLVTQCGLRLLLRRQYLADQSDHQQFEQIDQASGEYFDEQFFHDRQVRSRR